MSKVRVYALYQVGWFVEILLGQTAPYKTKNKWNLKTLEKINFEDKVKRKKGKIL